MFAGPIIAREVLTAPRPLRFYLARAAYVGLLLILLWTAWQSLIGWREVREVGVLARFGGIIFQFFAILQLTLMLFFAPLAAATAVAWEKDRRTFVLLLMTDLSDLEIVLGKLAASLLLIGTLLLTTVPVLFLCLLLGGVAPLQVLDVLGVTAASGLAGGALGMVVALWRDRTFQSLALTVLLLVLALAGTEAIGAAWPGASVAGVPLVAALNPFHAALAAIRPASGQLGQIRPTTPAFMGVALLAAVALTALAVRKLRVWNPGRNEPREQREGEEAESSEALLEIEEVVAAVPAGVGAETVLVAESRVARGRNGDGMEGLPDGEDAPPPGFADRGDRGTTGLHVPRRTHRRVAPAPRPYREAWDNPILWRELRTRAYGAKPLIVKGAYLLAFLLGLVYLWFHPDRPGYVLLPLAILSLILVNAQGVTALTSERDTGALDLLLVTDLTPKEFIYGKLYGVLYNAKEMLAVPVLLAWWSGLSGGITLENALYGTIDFLLLAHFAAMLGLHAAITYTSSRAAVAHSLGTIFFLMVGLFVCAGLIIAGDREFGRQLLSFMIFIGAGSVALYGSLGAKNPSQAIALVALLTPFWSFYCVISLLQGDILAAFLVSAGVYGFALLAMLVPAVGDFDIALGRTNAIQG